MMLIGFILEQLADLDLEELAAVLLLKVEQLLVEVEHVGAEFLGRQTQRAEVRVHHHAVCVLVDSYVALNVVCIVYSVSNCGVPAEFEFKLLREHDSIREVVAPEVVPEVGADSDREQDESHECSFFHK